MTVRTTVDLDDDTHRRLKVLAAEHSLSLSDVTRALYALALDDPATRRKALHAARRPEP